MKRKTVHISCVSMLDCCILRQAKKSQMMIQKQRTGLFKVIPTCDQFVQTRSLKVTRDFELLIKQRTGSLVPFQGGIFINTTIKEKSDFEGVMQT